MKYFVCYDGSTTAEFTLEICQTFFRDVIKDELIIYYASDGIVDNVDGIRQNLKIKTKDWNKVFIWIDQEKVGLEMASAALSAIKMAKPGIVMCGSMGYRLEASDDLSLIGSWASVILEKASCSVLLIRPDFSLRKSTMFCCASDGSACSRLAVSFVMANLARSSDEIIVRVYAPLSIGEKICRFYRGILMEALRHNVINDYAVVTSTEGASSNQTIAQSLVRKLAHAPNNSIIVVGAFGEQTESMKRSREYEDNESKLGSIAYYLANNSNCSVLVVRPQAK